jgi:hypothetical protein
VRIGAGQTDLQFRLRCRGCNRWSGFRITIFDNRTRGDNWKPRLERVVVAGNELAPCLARLALCGPHAAPPTFT